MNRRYRLWLLARQDWMVQTLLSRESTLRATDHTLTVWSCASVDSHGKPRHVAQNASHKRYNGRARRTLHGGLHSEAYYERARPICIAKRTVRRLHVLMLLS